MASLFFLEIFLLAGNNKFSKKNQPESLKSQFFFVISNMIKPNSTATRSMSLIYKKKILLQGKTMIILGMIDFFHMSLYLSL